MMNHQTCHLISRINNINYIIATLSFDLKKEQLFYLFRYPKECQLNYKQHFKSACEYCIINLNTKEKASQLLEISFHTNDTHIKTIKGGRENKIYQKKERFLPNNELVKLIMLESFYVQGNLGSIFSQQAIFKAQYDICIATIPESINYFSVILILVHRELGTKDILLNSCLFFSESYLPLILFESVGYKIGRINAFKDFDLMVMTIPHVPDIDPKNQPMPIGPIRSINIDQPAEGLLAIAKKNFA